MNSEARCVDQIAESSRDLFEELVGGHGVPLPAFSWVGGSCPPLGGAVASGDQSSLERGRRNDLRGF